jgi:hypothetical protein
MSPMVEEEELVGRWVKGRLYLRSTRIGTDDGTEGNSSNSSLSSVVDPDVVEATEA